MTISKTRLKKIKSDINLLVTWVHTKNWEVIFKNYGDNACIESDCEITINKKQSLENQLHSLIHECGHMIIRLNKKFSEKYPMQYKAYKKNYNRSIINSKAFKVDTIAEEIDAWRKGRALAQKFGIKIDEKKFLKEMGDSVFTYIESAI